MDRSKVRIECQGAALACIDELIVFQGKLKTLSDDSYFKLKTEILKDGFSEPVSVWKEVVDDKVKLNILNGHQRVHALHKMREEGIEVPEIPINWVHADSLKQAKRKVLALTSTYGEMSIESVTEYIVDSDLDLEDLKETVVLESVDIDEVKLPDKKNVSFVASTGGITPQDGEDDVPDAVALPKVKRGEVFTLGSHRLMCGDSKNLDDVKKLFNGEQADLIVTSPPYADQREYNIGDFDWLELMNGVFDGILSVARPETHILVNLGLSHKDRAVNPYWNPWLDHAKEKGWPLFGWYVWDKGHGFPGHHNGRLGPAHEFVFHFSQKTEQANKWVETNGSSIARGPGGMRFRQKDGSKKAINNPESIGQPFKIPDSVIRINREMARGDHTKAHPAVYPVAFAEFLILTWHHERARVYEPFCGSGTTLIAAEKTNRCGFGMEIDPVYCQVILDRWAKFSGKDPVREDGSKWSDIRGELSATREQDTRFRGR